MYPFSCGSPVLARGKTYQQGQTINTSDLPLVAQEGLLASFIDVDPTTPEILRSGELVTCRLVRNTSGIALLPRRLVTYAAGYGGKRVDGYGATTAVWCAGVVDEFLPTAGVQNNDLFWIVVAGNTEVLTDLAAAASGTIAEFGTLVCLTAATSQCTTAGRVSATALAVTETALVNQTQNRIGRAMTVSTSSQTNRSLPVKVNFFF